MLTKSELCARMRILFKFILILWTSSLIGQSFLNNPTVPCRSDSMFNILDLEPVIQGTTLTDTSDITMKGVEDTLSLAIPDSAINGAFINLTMLIPNQRYGVCILSESMNDSVIFSDFIVYDLSGDMYLQDLEANQDTAEFCKSQLMEFEFVSHYNVPSLLYFIDYGDGTLDTTYNDATTFHKYDNPGTFEMEIQVSTSISQCSKSYKNITIVKEDNNLKMGLVEGDTVTCIGDTDGRIVLRSFTGGVGEKMFALSGRDYSTNKAWFSLSAGFYKVSVRDSNHCIVDTIVRVANPPPIMANIDVLLPHCNNDPKGAIELSRVRGGWGGHTIVWNGYDGGEMLTDIDTNSTVSLYIYDRKGCGVRDTIKFDTCIQIIVGQDELHIDDLNILQNQQSLKIQSYMNLKQVELFDLMGRLIYSESKLDQYFEIPLHTFESQTYILRMIDEEEKVHSKKIQIR